MIKRIFAVCLLLAITQITAQGQGLKCAADSISKRRLQNPVLFNKRQAIIQAANNWINNNAQRTTGAVLTVPVVFHIFHDNGPENISKAQILDQLRVLNEDFRRLNADTINTPAPFQSIAADCQIEFKLAQIDPFGNCTDGIVRVKTPLTNSATDAVKDLSSWDNDRYLNMWVVKSIYNFFGGGGTILGYAYYPGTAPFGYDGCICRADCIGSIEYVSARALGRTATHEVGHYLDLAHVWGDFTCGDDGVADTPPALGPNYGCPSFPRNSATCNTDPNGELFVDYMDYTDDFCMNTFTFGQKQRMDATFAGYRANLVSFQNLIATGVLNPPVSCAMVADFRVNRKVICLGDSVQLIDQSWNGNATSRTWTFSNGFVVNNSDSIAWITFPNPGVYDVTITVSNAAGTSVHTEQACIIVKPYGEASVNYSENFDNNFNFSTSLMKEYSSGTPFSVTNLASVSGNNSLFRGYSSVSGDTLATLVFPSLDFSNNTQVFLQFKMAAAVPDTASKSTFKVEMSTNCGLSWMPRYVRRGPQMATTASTGPGFIPSAAEWRQENVSLAPAAGNNDVLLRMTLTNGMVDNFFLDDINIVGATTGLNNIHSDLMLNVYPNPSCGTFTIDVPENSIVKNINVYDVPGKLVQMKEVHAGVQQITLTLPAGMYYLQFGSSFHKIILR
jgi:PKD repeat protein